jgi:hypothetical protein
MLRAGAAASVANAGTENNASAAISSAHAALDRRHRRPDALHCPITSCLYPALTRHDRNAGAGQKNVGDKVSCGLAR